MTLSMTFKVIRLLQPFKGIFVGLQLSRFPLTARWRGTSVIYEAELFYTVLPAWSVVKDLSKVI